MISIVIQRAVMQGIPLLFGSTGEILTEKSGNLNLGIPGIMYVGAISGVAGAFLYEQSCGGAINPLVAVVSARPVTFCRLTSYGIDILLFNSFSACQSKRYGSCTDYIRYRYR